jgi:sugar O-acyltransferase (sialic acid O-acetyltransferase NeuD family)
MRKPIVIVGGGGHGREVLQIVCDINDAGPRWDVCGFLIDPAFAPPCEIHTLPVLGGIDWLAGNTSVHVALAIGRPHLRRLAALRIADFGNICPALVHPRAWVGAGVTLEAGCIVFPHSSLTTDIALGPHVHVNLNCTIGHDCTLGAFASLYQSVSTSGNVRIGEGVECGTGARLIPDVQIGAWSVLGAGAVVTKSLPSNITAVGAPARVIKARPQGWHEA